MSLLKIIEQAGVGTDACADVLGVDHEIFQQWVNSQREMPPSYASILAATLGVKAEVLTSNSIGSVDGQPKESRLQSGSNYGAANLQTPIGNQSSQFGDSDTTPTNWSRRRSVNLTRLGMLFSKP
jgi:DNA-binding transcriptional regulator YdaS (Cro superfamily)